MRISRVVIIGAGLAGSRCAETLRALKPKAEVLAPEYQQTLSIP